jgi:hypothetical protein
LFFSSKAFKKDIFKSANLGKSEEPYELGAILADESDASFEWLTKIFKTEYARKITYYPQLKP